ncbi:hypothetical protein [Pseudomonas frederiksbergensis]|uniref:Uncharacterized protein n=1 Tax=Pseudomonas frederiksbergensis TaxID=104087 RepID=A0A423KDB5_9PSED|nr:hypothetical protein [Pseudomonas frederiksbergensis]RON50366.1 hypothetical protein BK665_21535 [Pseudomonas frederiksbergensis]
MASAILTSAKHGAYLAIGLYVAMVLVVSLSAQSQHERQAPVEVAYPGIQFEHRSQNAVVDHAVIEEAVGA